MTAELPKYDELFQPVLDALKSLGGSGQPAEVRDLLVERLSIPDSALEITVSNGTQLFLSRVQWARLYLAKTGYLDSSKRGVWSLTQKGKTATIGSSDNFVAHLAWGLRSSFPQ
jgi:restriction system protein